jgi:Holliday junction resolvasome RuvABC endonuclease subunit
MKLLAIDPAIRAVGWALFINNYLHNCGVILQYKGKENLIHSILEAYQQILILEKPDFLVIEKPHISINRAADPNDLIKVALVTGICLSLCPHYAHRIWLPTPQEWKGNTPKLITYHRTVEKFNKHERFIVEEDLKNIPKSLHHNAYDAIALGLKALERWKFRND